MSNESATTTPVKNDVTEEIPAVITKELIEGAVRKRKGRDDVTLANYSVTSGSKYGSGFMLPSFVVNAEVKDGNSSEATSIFIKTISKNPMMSSLARESGLFKKEVVFYNDLVPGLVKLRNDRGAAATPWNPPVPSFYGGFEDVEKKEGVVMVGNLGPLGFTMADVKKGLDYDHCQLVFKAIAEMHAMSFAFMKTTDGNVMADTKYGDMSFDVYMSECFDGLWEAFGPAFNDRLAKVISKLRAAGSQYADAVEELSTKLSADPVGIMKKLLSLPTGPFGVVCHGDLWTNNLMFRYDGDKPVEVKLIDWQIWRPGLPTPDLALLLFSSTRQSLRRQHLDDLLRLYHVTFLETLRGVNVEAPEFTFDALKDIFRKTAMFGLIMGYDMLPGILADKKGLDDLEGVTDVGDIYTSSAFDVTNVEKNDLLTERLMEVAEDAVWMELTIDNL